MKSDRPRIFHNIEPAEYEDLVSRRCIRVVQYSKDSVVLRTGEDTREFGILLDGEVHIESIDLWGNRLILHSIAPGQSFAETFAFCKVPMMVDVTAVQDSRVLFVDLSILLTAENHTCSWYPKLLQNLLILSTGKNLAWSTRMLCITSKNIRTRVMTYLSGEAVRRGTTEFSIPFDRQQLADYLNVERTALSKELGRMQKEGILTFRKNHFHLNRIDNPEP